MEWELSRTASFSQALFLLLREAETARVGGGQLFSPYAVGGEGDGGVRRGLQLIPMCLF